MDSTQAVPIPSIPAPAPTCELRKSLRLMKSYT